MKSVHSRTWSHPPSRIRRSGEKWPSTSSRARAHRKSDADAIIGFTIALEALFVPGLAGENGYRFRLNGVRYLGSTESERQQIYSDLKDLYAIRSQLVHGGPAKDSELRDARLTARRLTGRALTKALKEGWPTGKSFEDSALS
jgi:Apea-like HEPN